MHDEYSEEAGEGGSSDKRIKRRDYSLTLVSVTLVTVVQVVRYSPTKPED